MAKTLYIILLAVLTQCEGYRILMVFPLPSVSHGILGEGYVRHLLDAGHEVRRCHQDIPSTSTHPQRFTYLPQHN